VITKPEEHEIDRAGKLLVRRVLESIKWVLNDVQEDYGIDSNIQLFEGEHPTGAWFHVQLKSSRHSEYSTDQTFISQSLSLDHARHYAREMRQPVILIHADLGAEKIYWHAPQLDHALHAALESSTAKTITVRIPTRQDLPNSAPHLLTTLDNIYLALATRELLSSSTRSFAESLTHFPDQQRLAQEFHNKSDLLRLNRMRELFHSGHFRDARSRAEVLLNDPDSIVESKFWAQVQLHAIDCHETIHAGKPQNELPDLALKHARALQRLTHSGPNYLKFYALITRHAAELEIMAHESFSLFMAHKVHVQSGGNPMMILGLYARRSALTRRLVSKYNRCVRLARYAASYKGRWALGRALSNIVKAIGSLMVTLRAEEHGEFESSFARSALQICKLAVWICNETNDAEGTVVVILSALLMVHREDSDAYRWAVETAHDITDVAVRTDALGAIERAARRWRGEKIPGDYEGDTKWQIMQNIATGIGLDLSDEKSPLVRELRAAARDDSPERVLLQCEHLLAAQGAIGPTARKIRGLLGIDTVGSKVIHCTLHDYHAEGQDLDTAYGEFKRSYCDSCPDTKPRPSDWHYDEDARLLELIKYSDFLARFRGKPFGLRYTDED